MSLYADYNATTPLAEEAIRAMEPFLKEHFANASSLHHMGRKPAQALREARRQVASLLGAQDEKEIVFTSGGTESNNAAIFSALKKFPTKKKVVTSTVEHSSVRNVFEYLSQTGYEVCEIEVDKKGALKWDQLQASLTEDVAIVSLMSANNETGVLFPVFDLGKMIQEKGILFHVDAVQSIGKMPLSLKNKPIDFLSLSGHKFYGPKGVGALYIRSGVEFNPLIKGGTQERGRRAGTENIPGIVGLGTAAALALKDLADESSRIQALRDAFEKKVTEALQDVCVNGSENERLPNTSNLCFQGLDAETLLMVLDQKGVCVSRGSACMSGSGEPSHVLKAMGLSDEEARGSLRFSFGRGTMETNMNHLFQYLCEAVDALRSSVKERKEKGQ